MSAFTETSINESTPSNSGLFSRQDSFLSPINKSLKLNTLGGYTCAGQNDDISLLDFNALQAAGAGADVGIIAGTGTSSTDKGAGSILKSVIDSVNTFIDTFKDSFFCLMVMLPNMIINEDNTWEVPSNLIQLGYVATDGGILTQTDGYVIFDSSTNTYSPDNTRNAHGYPTFTNEQWTRIANFGTLNMIQHQTNSGRQHYLRLPYMLFHAIKLK